MTDSRFPLIAAAFPDYPIADLPAIPADWSDASYRNDVCPSFDVAGRAHVFVDYADPAAREMQGGTRFTVWELDAGGSLVEESEVSSDQWADVLARVAAIVAGPVREVPPCAPGRHVDTGRGVCAICGGAIADSPYA